MKYEMFIRVYCFRKDVAIVHVATAGLDLVKVRRLPGSHTHCAYGSKVVDSLPEGVALLFKGNAMVAATWEYYIHEDNATVKISVHPRLDLE